MTRVVWGDTGTRFFETGVDRGVLYLSDRNGVPWNGLTSVSESPSGGEAKPYYQDGEKFLNVSSREEFEATIEAFGCPPEFAVCDGTVLIQNGLFVTQQPRRAFNLSYRTMIGNDIDPEAGYKIHLVYNALAAPAERSNATVSDSPEALTLSWALTTLPPSFTGYKPTAHLVIDSRSTPDGLLRAIEDILYGSDVADARIPMPSELISMFQSEGPVRRYNLDINPNFRNLNGTVEVRRNLASNPAYKTTTTAVEVRRNLATNPSYETSGAGWLANNGTSHTMSQDSSVKNTGTYSAKSTPSASTIGASRVLASVYNIGGQTIPLAPNEIVTVSLHVAHNAGSNAEANLYVVFLDSASAAISTANNNVFVPIGAANTTTMSRVKYTAPAAPANTAYIRVICVIQKVAASPMVAAGEFAWMDDVLIEKASVMLPYFDGGTTSGNLTNSWVGTAHASASIGSAIQPASACFRAYVRPNWVVVGGATDGSNSMRTYLGSSSTSTAAPQSIALFSYDQPPAAPGDTMIGYFRARVLNATSAITLSSRVFAYNASSISSGAIASTSLPSDGSWVDVYVPAYDMPATTTSVRLYVTVAPGDLSKDNVILETSNVLIEKASASLPWFDGNTAASNGLTYSWTGTANNSFAIATGAQPRGWSLPGSSSKPAAIFQADPLGGAYIYHSNNMTDSAWHYSVAVDANTLHKASAIFTNPSWNIGPMTVYIACRSYDAGGANVSWYQSTQYVLQPGESRKVSLSLTTGSNEVQLRNYVMADGPGFCKVEQVYFGPGSSDVYFDGDTPDADGYFYSWENNGVADSVRSVMNSWLLN